jgi:hypothetical protein
MQILVNLIDKLEIPDNKVYFVDLTQTINRFLCCKEF